VPRRAEPACAVSTVGGPGIASPGVLSPSSVLTSGAPFAVTRSHSASAEAIAVGELEPRKVKVARPSPVPSSGFLPLSTVPAALAARADPLRDPPFAVTPRRFAALFHAARALWSRPSELSLLEEPYPLSRASCFLAGSHSTAQRRGTVRGIRDTFRRRVDLFAAASTGLAGLEGRDDGSLESLGAARLRVATRVCSVSPRIGRARRTRRPARPLRSLAPLESPFPRRPPPWPGCDRWVVALLGFLPSRACSSSRWVRFCARTELERAGPDLTASSRAPRPATRNSQVKLRPWGLEPTIRRRAPVDQTGLAPVEQRP